MAQVEKLPYGYGQRVKEIKSRIKVQLDKLNKGNYTIEQKIQYIYSNFDNRNMSKYIMNGDIHISFDYEIVGCEVIIDHITGKCKLFESCVVFIYATDDYVDNLQMVKW